MRFFFDGSFFFKLCQNLKIIKTGPGIMNEKCFFFRFYRSIYAKIIIKLFIMIFTFILEFWDTHKININIGFGGSILSKFY